jgi:hypothetical protein
LLKAIAPATTIAALSRIVRTGRRMKSSDRFMACCLVVRRVARPAGGGGVAVVAAPRPASLIAADADDAPFAAPMPRRRAGRGPGVAGRAIDHRRAGTQVLAPVEDDPLARLDTGDGDLLAARVGDLDRPRRHLRGGVDDVDDLAARALDDRRLRDHARARERLHGEATVTKAPGQRRSSLLANSALTRTVPTPRRRRCRRT